MQHTGEGAEDVAREARRKQGPVTRRQVPVQPAFAATHLGGLQAVLLLAPGAQRGTRHRDLPWQERKRNMAASEQRRGQQGDEAGEQAQAHQPCALQLQRGTHLLGLELLATALQRDVVVHKVCGKKKATRGHRS